MTLPTTALGMACCHGQESSAHRKSKPSTLQCPSWDTKQLCIRPHRRPGDRAHPGTARHLEDSPCSAFSPA